MRWRLVVIAFGTNASGAPQDGSVYWKPYASEAECNRAGRNLRDIIDIPAGRRCQVEIQDRWATIGESRRRRMVRIAESRFEAVGAEVFSWMTRSII
jgi:hypothetical protein